MPGYVVWICMYDCSWENSGEISCSHPSKPVSPKQAQIHTRPLAQVESSRFERGTISLRREGLASARTRGRLRHVIVVMA